MYCEFSVNKETKNTESVEGFVFYLEKEDKNRDVNDQEYGFFNEHEVNMDHEKAVENLEHTYFKKGLGTHDTKFYSVMIAFSEAELKGRSNEDLISFVRDNFSEIYSQGVMGKDVDPSNICWVGKLEEERTFKGDDLEVKEGRAKSGDLKPGDNRHVHVIVTRKTFDDKQISPLSNHFREGVNKGAVKSGYDQDVFKLEIEKRFDKNFSYVRNYDQSVEFFLKPYRKDILRSQSPSLNKDKLNSIIETTKRAFSKEKQIQFITSTIKRNMHLIDSKESLIEVLRAKNIEVTFDNRTLYFQPSTISNPKKISLVELKDVGENLKKKIEFELNTSREHLLQREKEIEREILNSAQSMDSPDDYDPTLKRKGRKGTKKRKM